MNIQGMPQSTPQLRSARFQSATPGLEPGPTESMQWSAQTPAAAPAEAPKRPSHLVLKAGLGLGLVVAGVLAGTMGPAVARVQSHEQQTQTQVAQSETSLRSEPLASHTGRSPEVRSFGHAPVKLLSLRGHDDKGDLHMDWTTQTLTNKSGQPLWTPSGQGEVIAAFEKEGDTNWNHHFTLQPAGHVGHYVSMVVTEQSYTGGMHENKEAHLVTVDDRTGSEVTLDQLLKPADFQKVVDTVMRAQSPAYEVTPEQAQDFANHSFALFQEGGKTKLAVAVPAQIQVDRGNVAEYVFQMPTGH